MDLVRIVLASPLLAAILPLFAAEAPQADPARTAELIVEAANEARRAHGAAPLARNARLADAARGFARFLARTDQLAHTADGLTPAQRASRQGYDYCMVSENIGYQYRTTGFTSSELAIGLVAGWKRSPGHRKNLLDADATETGAGVARSEKSGRYYAVQVFGRPAASGIEFTVANESREPAEYRVGTRPFRLPPRSERTHQECAAEGVTLRGTTVQPAHGERLMVR